MAEGTNVGSVSLGVEIDADFTGQLNKMADRITTQLSNAFKKISGGNVISDKITKDLEKSMTTLSESIKYQMDMVGANLENSMSRVDAMLEKTTTTVDSTLKSMVAGLNTAIDQILAKLKSLETTAQNTSVKIPGTSAGNMSVPTPRGPPIKATKEDLLAQKSMLNDESNQIEERVSGLRAKLKQMSSEYTKAVKLMGESPKTNKKAAEIEKTKLAIQKLENQLGKIGYKSEVLDRQILKLEQDGILAANKQVANNNKVGASTDKLKAKTASLGNTLKSVNNSTLAKPVKGLARMTAFPFKKMAGGLKLVGKSAQDAGNMGARGMNVLDKSFWKVFKKVLILGVMTKALKGFIGYIGGALMANEQYRASLATVQLNLAAAFQPIMDIIIPALVNLMAVLAKVTGYMAAFIATLFGTTYKASVQGAKGLKAQTDAYKELGKNSGKTKDKVKKNAKEMKTALAGFDEINTLNLKDDSDNNDSGNNADSDVKQPGWETAAMTEIGDTSKFDKFKKILDGIFKPFQQSWANEGANTIAAAKYAFSEILKLLESIGKSMYTVWTNGTGVAILDSIQRLLQNILYILGDVAKAFRLAWDDEGRGTQIVQNIANAILNTTNLFGSITSSIRTVWQNIGVDIATNCLTILQNVSHLFSQIPKTFDDSWKKANIGTQFLQHLGNGFNNILGLISGVTGSMDGLWAKFGPAITDTVMQCLNATAGLFESMTLGFKGIWDNGGQHLFESIGRLATRIFELAGRFYSEFIAPIAGSLMEVLGPALGKVLDFVAGILDKFSELIEWLLKDGNPTLEILITTLGAWAIASKGVALAMEAPKLALGAFNAVVGVATTAAGLFKGALAFICTPAGAVTLAITAIIAIGVLLYKHWDEIGPKLQAIWNKVKEFFGNLMNTVVTKVKELISKWIQFHVDLVTKTIQGVGNILREIGTFFTKVFTALANFAVNLIAKWVQLHVDLVNKTITGVGNILRAIGNFLQKFFNVGLDLLRKLANGIGNGMGQAVSAMANVGRNIWNTISRINLFDVGRNLLRGLWNGISSVTDWILNKLEQFCDNVLDTICDFFGIHSPSRVFRDQIGKMLPRGMAIGIEAESGKVLDAMDSLMKIPAINQPEIALTSDVKSPTASTDDVVNKVVEILTSKDDKDNGPDDDKPVVIMLDGEVIAKSSVKYINRMSKRAGEPVIEI